MSANIKDEAVKVKRQYLERVIGQAYAEGSTADAIDSYLRSQEIQDPGHWRRRVEARKTLPYLGAQELKNLGGRDAFRQLFGLPPATEPTADTSAAMQKGTIPIEDFVAFMPRGSFINMPTGNEWQFDTVRRSVQSPDPQMSSAEWLMKNRTVEQMSWCPGMPPFIENKIFADGGWSNKENYRVFNQYRPPLEWPDGDPQQASRWVDHVRLLYPNEADHIIAWFAQRVQHPEIKINHALVLGGSPGIGKDTILDPVREAVGSWNFKEIAPSTLMERFNPYLKAVILRVSEARDLGDTDRYAFYERSKVIIASPPEVLRIDEKHRHEYPIPNVVGAVITTNYQYDALYLPPDDRRHFVAWSEVVKESFNDDFFTDFYRWYESGGRAHVIAYLRTLDLTDFDPKAAPPRTDAWHDLVNFSKAPEDAEMADAIEKLGSPPALTIEDIASAAGTPEFLGWLADRKNRRGIPHRLTACGYSAARNPGATDGLWVVKDLAGSKSRQTIYTKQSLTADRRLEAATIRAASVGAQQAAAGAKAQATLNGLGQ